MKKNNQKCTLLAGKIINLTEKKMWTYGTSGELTELKPVGVKYTKGQKLPTPADSTFYAVELNSFQKILGYNPDYNGKLIIPKFRGKGPMDEDIYYFNMPNGDMNVRLITDGMGYHGSIIVEKDRLSNRLPYTLRMAHA